MLELILLLTTALLAPPLIRAYVLHLEPQGDRHDGFERWCRERPIVLAILAPRDADALFARLSRDAGGGRGWVNSAGVFPWPSYRVSLSVERLSGDVIALRIASAQLVRGRSARATLGVVVAHAARGRSSTDELWLHGHLRPLDEDDDPNLSWLGTVDREGRLLFRAARELPYWLVQTFGKGPPRRPHEEAREAAVVAIA